MRGYVLVRDDGKYRAISGMEHSYTTNLRYAEIFPTREAAERDRWKLYFE